MYMRVTGGLSFKMKIMMKNFQEQILHLNTFCCFSFSWRVTFTLIPYLTLSLGIEYLLFPLFFIYLLSSPLSKSIFHNFL